MPVHHLQFPNTRWLSPSVSYPRPNLCAPAAWSSQTPCPAGNSHGCAAERRRAPTLLQPAVPFKNRPRRDYVSQKALPARYVTFPAKRPLGQKEAAAAAAAGEAGARGGGARGPSRGPSCAPRPGAWTRLGRRRASASLFEEAGVRKKA